MTKRQCEQLSSLGQNIVWLFYHDREWPTRSLLVITSQNNHTMYKASRRLEGRSALFLTGFWLPDESAAAVELLMFSLFSSVSAMELSLALASSLSSALAPPPSLSGTSFSATTRSSRTSIS